MNNLIDFSKVDITVKTVRTVEYKDRTNKFVFEQICRDDYGLVFVKNGFLKYTKDGKTININKDEILFIKKGETYTISSDETPYAFYMLAFDIYNDDIPFLNRVTKISHQKKFLELFEEGWLCVSKMNSGYNIILKKILYDIIHNIYQEYYASYTSSASISNIEKAKIYIDTNYKNKITIDEIAKISGFSRSHFKKLFSKYYKTSPSDYITTVRINRAKSMLKSNMFSLSEIATECGFSNEYYFSRVFKNIVGCPPKKY